MAFMVFVVLAAATTCLAAGDVAEVVEWQITGMACHQQFSQQVVYHTTDGTNKRCFVVDYGGEETGLNNTYDAGGTRPVFGSEAATPPDLVRPRPVLFFAHGMSGTARKCNYLADLDGHLVRHYAKKFGFVLVCLEALQYYCLLYTSPSPRDRG